MIASFYDKHLLVLRNFTKHMRTNKKKQIIKMTIFNIEEVIKIIITVIIIIIYLFIF